MSGWGAEAENPSPQKNISVWKGLDQNSKMIATAKSTGIILITPLDSKWAKLTHPAPGTWIPFTVKESQKRWPKNEADIIKPSWIKTSISKPIPVKGMSKPAIKAIMRGAGAEAIEWVIALLLCPRWPESMIESSIAAITPEMRIQNAPSPMSLAKVDATVKE